MPIINSNYAKAKFRINGPSNFFFFFHSSEFQMTIVKNLMEKPSFFIIDFESSNEVLLRHKNFDLQIFDSQMTALLKVFEICTEIYNLLFDDTFKMYCCALC